MTKAPGLTYKDNVLQILDESNNYFNPKSVITYNPACMSVHRQS
jgi:hypothetical protein